MRVRACTGGPSSSCVWKRGANTHYFYDVSCRSRSRPASRPARPPQRAIVPSRPLPPPSHRPGRFTRESAHRFRPAGGGRRGDNNIIIIIIIRAREYQRKARYYCVVDFGQWFPNLHDNNSCSAQRTIILGGETIDFSIFFYFFIFSSISRFCQFNMRTCAHRYATLLTFNQLNILSKQILFSRLAVEPICDFNL